MSRQRISARTFRTGLILGSLTAMIAFAVMSIVHLGALEGQIRQAARMSTTDAWAIYQARLELQHFQLALLKHVGGGDLDRATLDLRLDILFSRVDVMKTGEDRERYLSVLHLHAGGEGSRTTATQVDRIIRQLEDALGTTEAILRTHPDLPAAPEAAERIFAVLAPQAESLTDLAAQATKWFNDASSQLISEVSVRQSREALALIGLLITAALAASALAVESHVARRAEREARAASERFREFAGAASDWLWETDQAGRLVWCSDRLVELLKCLYEGPATTARHWLEEPAWQPWREALASGMAFRDVTCRTMRLDGGEAVLRLAGTPSFDTTGQFLGFRGVGSDITESHLSHARIRFLADHDPLTALPNRRVALERLARCIDGSRKLAWLVVDLDGFKNINDSYGHGTADRLLVEASHRLVQCVGDSALVARLGGDEFSILLQDSCATAQGVQSMAWKVLGELARPYRVGDMVVMATASLGIALSPDDGRDCDAIVKAADVALYEAKKLGHATHQRFQPWMSDRLARRHQIDAALRRALEQQILQLHYQPQIDLKSDHVTGFEALLRWTDPELGPVSPAEFIPIAEETGLIVPLGRWTVQRACADAATWRGEIADATIGINLSPAQFADPELENEIAAALARSGLPR
ncbi:MAG TPA: diguanylate cyclase, partial [Geminicoccus sp.]|nr:diguanylate cyclase [Geminicoccus sp.]